MFVACAALLGGIRHGLSAKAPIEEPIEEPRVEASASAPAPPAEAPAPPASSAPEHVKPAFRGTHNVARVSWRFGAEVYQATIHTNGATGYADVSYVEPGHGPVVVRESLTLKQGARGTYVGSNAHYANDGDPAVFTPNVFYLTEGKSGAWTIVETCAVGTSICTRVTSR